MNIFCTSDCPVQSALWLDDLRVNKMIIESAQMLSTAVHYRSQKTVEGIYKPAYINHPCSIWARTNRSNFQWLVDHAMALCVIYSTKSRREHATLPIIVRCAEFVQLMSEGERTEFANCTPFKGVSYQDMPITTLYKTYMVQKWLEDKRVPVWSHRQRPPFYR